MHTLVILPAPESRDAHVRRGCIPPLWGSRRGQPLVILRESISNTSHKKQTASSKAAGGHPNPTIADGRVGLAWMGRGMGGERRLLKSPVCCCWSRSAGGGSGGPSCSSVRTETDRNQTDKDRRSHRGLLGWESRKPGSILSPGWDKSLSRVSA